MIQNSCGLWGVELSGGTCLASTLEAICTSFCVQTSLVFDIAIHSTLFGDLGCVWMINMLMNLWVELTACTAHQIVRIVFAVTLEHDESRGSQKRGAKMNIHRDLYTYKW